MEVAGVVFRQSPCFSSAAADVSSSRHSRVFPTVKKVNFVGVKQRSDRRLLGACVVAGEFSDKSHVRYYEGPRMAVKEKDEKEMKKEMKKQLKVLKGLSKGLNTFSEMGFGLSPDDRLDHQVKGKMISEATEVLLGQLQKLKEEKMEYKRMKKEEKAKKKADRMTMMTKTDCKDSSSSESSSSESDCDNVVNMSQLKTVATSNSNTHQETSSSVQVLEKPENSVTETVICKVGSSVDEVECGKKIEVCMGGKCKKSGAAMLLENFQAAVGGEAAVVGCKCMGKCREGPNVMVRSDEAATMATNSCGVLSHLSPFKPLKEKPKPVTLEFEKPLMDLQKKIIDVQKMANETGLDFSDQIISLENKYQQALKDLYTHLTPIQRVNIARHPNRPTFLDHVFNITDKFVELHGDRAGYDDPAVVTGIGTIDGRRFMFMGQQKGRNTKENIQRNFGMPTPHGYRKALRMMYYADHHGFPIVTFIDTPGAFADLKSEELGQGEAIAHNLRTMFGLKVPIVSIVMGEGGSGGALAIGCANKLLMLENAVFYVASPEACAAILWKSAKAAPKAAEKLKITANELCKLQIADGIIPEPLGGAHADPHWTSEQIKKAILESMDELQAMGTEELLRHRMLKFRKIGGFQEGLPVDPEKKVNMKRKEEPRPGLISDKVLQGEVNKLKEQIMKAKESSSINMDQNGMIEKLQREINYEFSEAAKALGIEEKLSKMREEFAKEENGQLTSGQIENLEKLKNEFNEKLATAPNYDRLKYKLSLLKEITEAKVFAENYKKTLPLKAKVNEKFKEVLEKSNLKQKIENLKVEVEKSGVSSIEEFDQELKEKVLEVREEVESEFVSALESSGVHVTSKLDRSSISVVKAKVDELNAEINQIIQDVIESTPDLKSKIEMLKLEVVKDKNTPSKESKEKIEALQQQIKEGVADVMSSAAIKEKYEQLQAELDELSGGSDGSLIKEPSYA